MATVGIIGCGAITRKRQAPACRAHAETTLAGFSDMDISRAQELAAQFGGRAYASMEEMLADPSVTAVCVCVPEQAHLDVTVRCLEAGKDVLLEKPMAMNLAEGEAIMQAWEKSGRKLMIAYSQRFYAEHTLAKRLMQEGEIGRVFSFRTSLSNPGVEYAVYGADQDFYDRNLNRIGGVMSNVGCHRIDLIRYLFDSEIEEVFAYTPVLDKRFSNGERINREDHAMLTLKLRNGISGMMWSSWCNYGAPDQGTWIFGDRGVLRTYDGAGVRVYRRNGGVLEHAVHRTQRDIDGWGVVTSFLDSLARGTEVATTGRDGLECMRVLDAIERSHAAGGWVRV